MPSLRELTPLWGFRSKTAADKLCRCLTELGVILTMPPDDAVVGCSPNVTPFNGDHHAGIQVLNTGLFADDQDPLRFFDP